MTGALPPALAARASWLALAVASVACAVTLLFCIATIASRPLDGSEGNFLFDAARIRHGLALYVDPVAGAWDYGPVPSRYYVLYTPFWALLLAAVPDAAAPIAARALSLASWYGLLAAFVAVAPRERRLVVAGAVLFVGGLYPLGLFAASGRPDALAVAIAATALLRSLHRGEVGAVEGALFALAPFFKPNIVAAGFGAIVADVIARRGRAWQPVLGAVGCAAVCAAGLQVASRGAWLNDLARSSWMPVSGSLWWEQIVSRGPFFALPVAYVAARAVHARSRLALWALGASVVWTLWSLAKIGSASNYWMEPCAVGLAIVTTTPPPALGPRLRAALGPLALAQALWTGVAAVKSSLDGLAVAPRKSAAIASARASCGAGESGVVVSDEAGVEVMLDGRLIEQALVVTQLVGRGAYPLSVWLEDWGRAEVRCLVMQSDLLERPATEVDADHDLLPPAMREMARGRFERVAVRDGLWIYRAR
jgi:hypothetical protein